MAAILKCDNCAADIVDGFSVIAKMANEDERRRLYEDFCRPCFEDSFLDILQLPKFSSIYIKHIVTPKKEEGFWSRIVFGERKDG